MADFESSSIYHLPFAIWILIFISAPKERPSHGDFILRQVRIECH